MVILKGVTLASVQIVDANSNVKPEYGNCGKDEDPNRAAEHGTPHFGELSTRIIFRQCLLGCERAHRTAE
jgi:hypothetical protein